jgi:peptidoglycan/xylan/chitin deacetylase (PgdA/CDA1 family)
MLDRHEPAPTAPPASPIAPAWPRIALRIVSPGAGRGRLQVLLFHRVHATADPLFPGEMTAARFRECLRWIADWFNVLPLGEAIGALAAGTLPARALSVTFDDGYADNVDVALPILREIGIPATFFVASGYLDGGRMWNDTVIEAVRRTRQPSLSLAAAALPDVATGTLDERRGAIATLIAALKHLPPKRRESSAALVGEAAGVSLPDDLMMTTAQLRALAAAGMEIGGHTVSHPILALLDDTEAREEIAAGREALAAITRQPIRLFAYPNGKPHADYRSRDVDIVKSLGFDAAFSTAWGVASSATSRYELPRFTPWDRTAARWAIRLARNHATRVEQVAPP